MKNVWFLSRQCYAFVEPEDGQYTVEIAYGGLDYANPDMFPALYPGEGKEYNDPREAAKVAIAVCEAWRKEAVHMSEFIGVAHGCTGGDTMPFEHDDFEDLIAWAERKYETLEKCDRCGDIIDESNKVTLYDYEGEYCSEHCANLQAEFYDIDSIICQVEDESGDLDNDIVYFSEGGYAHVNPDAEEIERFNLRDPEFACDLIRRLKYSWIYQSSIS